VTSLPLEQSSIAQAARSAPLSYAAFSAGADIKALLALLTMRLKDEPGCRFVVFYGNYGERSDAELEELLALKDRYVSRLALHFIMEREPEESELLTGKLDAGKLRALAMQLFDPRSVCEYLLSGPPALVAELRAELLSMAVEPARIHADERSAAVPAVTQATGATDAQLAAGISEVTVIRDGRRQTFPMRTGEESILDAAARAGLDLPFSCRAGVCSTCRTKLLSGEVELVQNYALEDWELAQGFILACQAHAKTAALEISYDET
jgi:ring-1,2-phenylacetyl-CoA epoxidase subunit PaaE